VLYFSDNGPNSWRFNGGMKGRKGSTDEGGIRSTCFMRWSKGLPANATVTNIAGAIDLLPTLTSLAGVPMVSEKPIDGINLSPWLRQEKTEVIDRTIFTTWANKVSARTQTHRLDQNGELYDMINDPGQASSLTNHSTELRKSLLEAVARWRSDVQLDETKPDKDTKSDAKPKRARSVDPRLIPVGYREFPRTWLPARDGEPKGMVQRSSSAPNSSYFVNWKATTDELTWDIDVHTAGQYEVTIDYTCAEAGSLIEVSFKDAKLEGKVTPAWDPPLYTNQDTLPRPPGESPMKEFRTLKLGTMALNKGSGPLTVSAKEIAGEEVMHLRAITLTLMD
jgi:hypothetical protein